MVKKLIYFLLIAFISFSLKAASYQVVFSEQIDRAESYACIEPLLDELNQHSGFIYSDSVERLIIIDDFINDSIIYFDVPGTPVKTIHYYSTERDTLYLYALINHSKKVPEIALIKLFYDRFSIDLISTNCYRGYGIIEDINSQDISFKYSSDNSIEGIWFETSLHFSDYIMTLGPEDEDISTSILYSLDLQNELIRKRATFLRSGYFVEESSTNLCSFINYTYYSSFGKYYGDSEWGRVKYSSVLVEDEFDNMITDKYSNLGLSYNLFVGNFKLTNPLDEIIFYGDTEDLLELRNRKTGHIACYSFEQAIPEEIWYSEITDITLDYIYNKNKVIIGRRGNDQYILIDYLTGQITDSVMLDRELSNITFFETDKSNHNLNVAGNVFDTIFVYQFEFDNKVSQPASSYSLPETFTLYQNHPNPFNGETRIEFENEVTQYLTLKVYNILGQEVNTLAEGVFTPGTYYSFWDGVDNNGIAQSSGIYFSKLQSTEKSQIIKLIYLK